MPESHDFAVHFTRGKAAAVGEGWRVFIQCGGGGRAAEFHTFSR